MTHQDTEKYAFFRKRDFLERAAEDYVQHHLRRQVAAAAKRVRAHADHAASAAKVYGPAGRPPPLNARDPDLVSSYDKLYRVFLGKERPGSERAVRADRLRRQFLDPASGARNTRGQTVQDVRDAAAELKRVRADEAAAALERLKLRTADAQAKVRPSHTTTTVLQPVAASGPALEESRAFMDLRDQISRMQQPQSTHPLVVAALTAAPLATAGGLALRSAAKAERARRNAILGAGGVGALALLSHTKKGRDAIDTSLSPKVKVGFLFRKPAAGLAQALMAGGAAGATAGAANAVRGVARATSNARRSGMNPRLWVTDAVHRGGGAARRADDRARRMLGPSGYYAIGGGRGLSAAPSKTLQEYMLGTASRADRRLLDERYFGQSSGTQKFLTETGGTPPSFLKDPGIYMRYFGDRVKDQAQKWGLAGAGAAGAGMLSANAAARARQIDTAKKWAVPGAVGLAAYGLLRS